MRWTPPFPSCSRRCKMWAYELVRRTRSSRSPTPPFAPSCRSTSRGATRPSARAGSPTTHGTSYARGASSITAWSAVDEATGERHSVSSLGAGALYNKALRSNTARQGAMRMPARATPLALASSETAPALSMGSRPSRPTTMATHRTFFQCFKPLAKFKPSPLPIVVGHDGHICKDANEKAHTLQSHFAAFVAGYRTSHRQLARTKPAVGFFKRRPLRRAADGPGATGH